MTSELSWRTVRRTGRAAIVEAASIVTKGAAAPWIPVEGTVRRPRRHAAWTARTKSSLALCLLLGLLREELLAVLLAQRLVDNELATVDAALRQRRDRLLAALRVTEHRDREAAALAVVIGREHQVLEIGEAGEEHLDLLHSRALVEIANEDLEHACACPGKRNEGITRIGNELRTRTKVLRLARSRPHPATDSPSRVGIIRAARKLDPPALEVDPRIARAPPRLGCTRSSAPQRAAHHRETEGALARAAKAKKRRAPPGFPDRAHQVGNDLLSR